MPASTTKRREEDPRKMEQLSRSMTRLLRHDGPQKGLKMDASGWCEVQSLLNLPDMKRWSVDAVRYVVEHSRDKATGGLRFQLQHETEKIVWVRATRGHSCLHEIVDHGEALQGQEHQDVDHDETQ